MARLGLDAQAARRELRRARGHVRAALRSARRR